jgi:5-methylcytosine-specific restriction endonuclease McrA
MITRDKGFTYFIKEPAKGRIERGECPSCGLPKTEWKRRKDWRCCSDHCTEVFETNIVIRDWTSLRNKAFFRDNHTCVKCGSQPTRKVLDLSDNSKVLDIVEEIEKGINVKYYIEVTDLIGDHIIPIALGGAQWDIDNIQCLCVSCNKIKTKEDMKQIAKARRIEKKMVKGQVTL